MKEGSNDLIIPFYLDTNALLDILASLEGGFSTAEDVNIRDSTADASKRSLGAEIGARFVTLLKFGVEGQIDQSKTVESEIERSLTRYNTYGSLLHKLRSQLFEKGLVRTLLDEHTETSDLWSKILPSEFIEIIGIFQPVPLIDAIANIDQLMELILPAIELSNKQEIQKVELSFSVEDEKLRTSNLQKSEKKKKIDEVRKCMASCLTITKTKLMKR